MNLAKLTDQEDTNGKSENSDITIRCYTEVGSMKSYGKLTIEAREIINIESQIAIQMALISVFDDAEDTSPSGTAVVPYDNIDAVYSALDKLKSLDPRSIKFRFIEAEFSAGDLKLIVFNNSQGKMSFAIQADTSSVHFDLNRIDEFKSLLRKAQQTIESCRQS